MPDIVTSHSSAPREIADGVWWLPECLLIPMGDAPKHLHTAPYLVVGSEKTLLWDTGSPLQWDGIIASVRAVLGDRPLDYVVPSHPEVAHSGNTPLLLIEYPEAQLVGNVKDYPFYWPDFVERMVHRGPGTELDLGDHTFVLLDALVKDLPSSQWGYETSQQVLFVGDGFAYSHQPPIDGDDRPVHSPGECTLLASELDGEPGPEQIVWITKAALYWTRFVRMDVFLDAFREMLATHPTRIVAPAHGAVIDDVDSTLWVIWEALGLAYSPDDGVKAAGLGLLDRG